MIQHQNLAQKINLTQWFFKHTHISRRYGAVLSKCDQITRWSGFTVLVLFRVQILTMPDIGTAKQEEVQQHTQGKMLLHTEYSLLSLLKDQDGVVHHHGLFKVCPSNRTGLYTTMGCLRYVLVTGDQDGVVHHHGLFKVCPSNRTGLYTTMSCLRYVLVTGRGCTPPWAV